MLAVKPWTGMLGGMASQHTVQFSGTFLGRFSGHKLRVAFQCGSLHCNHFSQILRVYTFVLFKWLLRPVLSLELGLIFWTKKFQLLIRLTLPSHYQRGHREVFSDDRARLEGEVTGQK